MVYLLQIACLTRGSPNFWTYLADSLPAWREPWPLPALFSSLRAKRTGAFLPHLAIPARRLQHLLLSPSLPLFSVLALPTGAWRGSGLEREGDASQSSIPIPGNLTSVSP